MYNTQALDIARTMLQEIRKNLEEQQATAKNPDVAYFDGEFDKLFKIQASLNKLEV